MVGRGRRSEEGEGDAGEWKGREGHGDEGGEGRGERGAEQGPDDFTV